MRFKFLLILSFLCFLTYANASKYDASITSGVFGGIPFWNSENFSDEYAMDPSLKFLRWYNGLNANAEFGDFSLHLNGSRSDGFDIRDDIPESSKYQVHLFDSKYHFSDTRLYRAYAQYKFTGGNVRAGRIQSYSRWLFGSVDGAALSYNISDNFSVSAFGGKGVKYGMFYDSDYDNTVAYADVSYKAGSFRAKAKYFYSDTSSVAGVDLFGKLAGVRYSFNFGYDITNSDIYDGSLALLGYVGKDLSLSANISRYRILLPFENFQVLDNNGIYYVPDNLEKTNYIDRFIIGASYKLFAGYSISFRQMVSMRLEQMDYLSYLSLNHRYFYVGLNYLGGDTGYNRLGVSLGGNYKLMDDLRISAGVASVDYMLGDYVDESTQSVTSYLQFNWDILNNLAMRTNLNYYHNNEAFDQKFRGGLSFQYKIKSGEEK